MKTSDRHLARLKRHLRSIAIVLSWNNYDDTKECLDSLLSSESQLSGIIVVDNGSKDGSIMRLKNTFADVKNFYLILNEQNLGFAAGVNSGLRFALKQEPDYIFLLNNDTVIDKECIKHLEQEAREVPGVGIIGPRIFYFNDSRRIWHGGGFFSWLKTGVVIPEKNKLIEECDEEARPVTFLTGCAMLIKREVFETIGLFDEDYFLYEEDLDFCLRASRAGFKLLYVPSAKVWHKIEAIAKDRTSPFVLYHMARSRILMLRKNFSWPYFLYGVFLHLLFYTPFRFLQILQGAQSSKSVWAWVRGTWAGLQQPIHTLSSNDKA